MVTLLSRHRIRTSGIAWAVAASGFFIADDFSTPVASGALGIYAIVEKAEVEPNEQAPERLQVWGAFALVEGNPGQGLTVSAAKRGYLYFRLPAGADGATQLSRVEAVKKEWADLKAVAGTGQAVGFGYWAYIGDFADLRLDIRGDSRAARGYVLQRTPGNPITDLRVRSASELPASPALYQTNAGIVKLTASGSHAAIVQQLNDALKRLPPATEIAGR